MLSAPMTGKLVDEAVGCPAGRRRRDGARQMSQACGAARNSCRPCVHQLERDADGDGGDDDADEEGEALLARRGADQKAGLQILRGIAGFGRGDADHAADGDGQRAKGRRGPAVTRKMAEVAISVAMVMPEMGLAELPIRPTMRELTVTKRNPKTTTSSEAARLAQQAHLRAGNGLEVEEEEHQHDQQNRADDARCPWRDRSRCGVACGLGAAPLAHVPEARA